MLPEREVQFAPTLHHAHRRPLGLGPAPLLGGAALLALVLAVVTFALGWWVAGVVLLAVAGAAVGLFVVAIRREPESKTAWLALSAAGRAGTRTRVTGVALRAWSGAAVRLLRIWIRRHRLRAQFRQRLAPLGEAVQLGDLDRATQLKAQADQMARALGEAERERSAVVQAARGQIARERSDSEETESLPVRT